MKVNSSLEKLKKALDPKKNMFFWFRHYKIIFFFCFLIVVTYGGFSWYSYLHDYQWDDAKKREFLEANFKETSFKETKFKDLIDRFAERDRKHTEGISLVHNIFGE